MNEPIDHRCPDAGTCHHGCPDQACFRVLYCSPLSDTGWDEWPEDVKAIHVARAKEIEKERESEHVFADHLDDGWWCP